MSEREKKVDEIFSVINHLTDEEKRELTIRARTTKEGIKAYTAFMYGVTTASSEVKVETKCEDEIHQEGEGTQNTQSSQEDDTPSSNQNNGSEEWL